MTTVFSNVCVCSYACVRMRVCVCVCVCVFVCVEQLSYVEENTKFVCGLLVPTRGTGGAVLPS